MKDFTTIINGYIWEIVFVNREKIQGNDGQTRPNELRIYIADDLRIEAARLCFVHELVHALLDTQGRCYQRKFELEEVCEFIAWNNSFIEEKVMEFNRSF